MARLLEVTVIGSIVVRDDQEASCSQRQRHDMGAYIARAALDMECL